MNKAAMINDICHALTKKYLSSMHRMTRSELEVLHKSLMSLAEELADLNRQLIISQISKEESL